METWNGRSWKDEREVVWMKSDNLVKCKRRTRSGYMETRNCTNKGRNKNRVVR